MPNRVEDRLDIADLMTGWLHRDQGEWDQLAALFHEGATIRITWFDGTAREFVEGSEKMAASAVVSKHVVTAPVITFNGDRALTETNAMVVADSAELGFGSTTHCRFWDRVEKRDGRWGIVHREAVYDMSHFDFPAEPIDIDQGAVGRHPREYAALAYLLEKSGSAVDGAFPTRGSTAEAMMKGAGRTWLQEVAG